MRKKRIAYNMDTNHIRYIILILGAISFNLIYTEGKSAFN